jgi:hypothetical protein
VPASQRGTAAKAMQDGRRHLAAATAVMLYRQAGLLSMRKYSGLRVDRSGCSFILISLGYILVILLASMLHGG